MKIQNTLRATALVVLAGMAMAGAAAGAPSFSLVWTGTSGSGSTGSDTIAALPGDTLTLDALVHIDAAGLSGFDFGLYGTGVTALSGLECPAGSSAGSSENVGGHCASQDFQFIQILGPGVTVSGSDLLEYGGGTLSPITAQPVPLWVGRGVFMLTAGEGLVSVEPNPLSDFNLSDGLLSGLVHTTTATIVPEPGSLGLLASGLLALCAARRRHWET